MPMPRRHIVALAALLVPCGPAGSAERGSFDHNGSRMEIDYDGGAITYRAVKRELRALVRPGFVAFTGEIEPKGVARGTAFTFRRNCEPAPYPVTGAYDPDLPGYRLRGAAPVREKNGCRVTGYSLDSPNARLDFVDLAPGASTGDSRATEAKPNPQAPEPNG